MAKKDKYEGVDLRKLPRDKRPKPSTGQSADARELPWEALSETEREVIRMLNSPGHGERQARTVEYLSEGIDGDNPRLMTRNALRRIVACGWVERAERATYKISKNGRARYERRPRSR